MTWTSASCLPRTSVKAMKSIVYDRARVRDSKTKITLIISFPFSYRSVPLLPQSVMCVKPQCAAVFTHDAVYVTKTWIKIWKGWVGLGGGGDRQTDRQTDINFDRKKRKKKKRKRKKNNNREMHFTLLHVLFLFVVLFLFIRLFLQGRSDEHSSLGDFSREPIKHHRGKNVRKSVCKRNDSDAEERKWPKQKQTNNNNNNNGRKKERRRSYITFCTIPVCAHVACDFDWVTVSFYSAYIITRVARGLWYRTVLPYLKILLSPHRTRLQCKWRHKLALY